jgi:hypothetical protein
MKGMRAGRVAIVVGVMLLIPVALTLLNPNSHVRGGAGGGWDWTIGWGLLVIGAILFVAGLGIDLALRKISNTVYRVLTICAIVAPILLVWLRIASSD